MKPQLNSSTDKDLQRHSMPKRSVKNTLRAGRVVAIALMGSMALAQDAGFSLENAFAALQKTPDWRVADLTYQTAQRNLETTQAATGKPVQIAARAKLRILRHYLHRKNNQPGK